MQPDTPQLSSEEILEYAAGGRCEGKGTMQKKLEETEPWGSVATIKIMGVLATTIVDLRIVIIQIGSSIFVMGVEP